MNYLKSTALSKLRGTNYLKALNTYTKPDATPPSFCTWVIAAREQMGAKKLTFHNLFGDPLGNSLAVASKS